MNDTTIRPRRDRPSDDAVIESYRKMGSVWTAGEELGIAGQTVCKRLKRLGIELTGIRHFTEDEKSQIVKYYTETGDDEFSLDWLVEKIGRTRSAISEFAGTLGLSRRGRTHTLAARQAVGTKAKERCAAGRHPRGMLGKRHSDELKAAQSVRTSEKWARDKAFGTGWMSKEAKANRRIIDAKRTEKGLRGETLHTRAKGGRADDLGDTWFRSSWERNYARYLNLLVKMRIVEWWDYEKQCFWFDGIKRGCVSYRPDFRVKYRNVERLEIIEIKGWVTDKDRTKWKRMKKYHPLVNLIVVGAKEYREIANRWSLSIPEWEKPGRKGPEFIIAFGKQVKLK